MLPRAVKELIHVIQAKLVKGITQELMHEVVVLLNVSTGTAYIQLRYRR